MASRQIAALEGINTLSKYGRFAGKVAEPLVGLGIGAVKMYQGIQKDGGHFGHNAKHAAIVGVGSVVGGFAGAEAGAAVGAAIGVWFGGIGAVPGAIIGGFVGGILGSKGGEMAGDALSE